MVKASNRRGYVQRINGISRSQSQLMSLSRQLSCNALSSSPPGEDLRDSGIWKTPVGELSAVLSLQVQAKCSGLFAETVPVSS